MVPRDIDVSATAFSFFRTPAARAALSPRKLVSHTLALLYLLDGRMNLCKLDVMLDDVPGLMRLLVQSAGEMIFMGFYVAGG